MRTFETGATRDDADDKPDYAGFLCPLVVERYGAYMHSHRKQADGKLRASDNWKKGMTIAVYFSSLCRHHLDLWKLILGFKVVKMEHGVGHEVDIEEACCAIMFNVMGILHEVLKKKVDRDLIRFEGDLVKREVSHVRG